MSRLPSHLVPSFSHSRAECVAQDLTLEQEQSPPVRWGPMPTDGEISNNLKDLKVQGTVLVSLHVREREGERARERAREKERERGWEGKSEVDQDVGALR